MKIREAGVGLVMAGCLVLACAQSGAAQTVVVTSSSNPSEKNEIVTFTATVTGTAPSGTVTFRISGQAKGPVTLVPENATTSTAKFVSDSLALSNTVYADYTGNLGSQSSSAYSQTVNDTRAVATTTSLTAVPNHATPGESVTFTATLTGSSGTPTGTVTFYSKDSFGILTARGSFANVSTASLATSSLSAGSNRWVANFVADAPYFVSTGNVTVKVLSEMAVTGNSATIASGSSTPRPSDHTDFGSATIGVSTVVRTFTIKNLAGGALNLTGTPKVAVDGANSPDFSVSQTPASPVNASSSTTFDVTFTPGGPGTRSATLRIDNDSGETPSYAFAIQATGLSACPTITPSALPNGTVGTAYTGTTNASGGTGPYTYAVTGVLPTGLSLSGNTVSGTPLSAGTFQITATDTAAPGTCTGSSNVAVIGSVIAPGDLVIREFRSRGPAGAQDEYIEIANRSAGALTIAATDGSTGFGIAAQGVGLLATIPNGTVIPAGGLYLAANSTPMTGYSLNDYGGVAAASHDASWTTDLPDNTGMGLFRSASTLTSGTVLDAVGFVGSSSPYLEGTGITVPGATGTSEVVYARNTPGGVIQDTGSNTADFYLGDTNAATFTPVVARLAAPGPQNATSHIAGGITFSLANPTKGATVFPNRYRTSTTSTTGTYYFRWKVTNNTGAAITRLRIRVSNVTTLNSPGYVAAGTQADFRLIASADASIAVPGTVTALGLTLEPPPTGLPQNGGYNASARVVLPGGTLADGASVYLNVAFFYAQAGRYSYFVSGEAK